MKKETETLFEDDKYRLTKTPSYKYHFECFVEDELVVSIFFDLLKVSAQGDPYDIKYEAWVDVMGDYLLSAGEIQTTSLPSKLCDKLNNIHSEENRT